MTAVRYRGSSLLNVCYKVSTKILNNRISKVTEIVILEEHNGFRKGRSCKDLYKNQTTRKQREFHLPTCSPLHSKITKRRYTGLNKIYGR